MGVPLSVTDARDSAHVLQGRLEKKTCDLVRTGEVNMYALRRGHKLNMCVALSGRIIQTDFFHDIGDCAYFAYVL